MARRAGAGRHLHGRPTQPQLGSTYSRAARGTFCGVTLAESHAGRVPFFLPGSAADPGPAVARVFMGALSLVGLAAWLPLGAQVTLLLGEHGLSPARQLFEQTPSQGMGWWQLPALFFWVYGDAQLPAGCVLGATLCVLWTRQELGVTAPRLCR